MDQSAHFCRFCGSTLLNDSKFCENCGAPVATVSPQVNQGFLLSQEDNPIQTTKSSELEHQAAVKPLPALVPQKPAPQPRRNNKPNTCLVILGMIGILLICLSLLAVAVNYIGRGQINALIDSVGGRQAAPTQNIQTQIITATATIQVEPLPIEPSPTLVVNYGYLPFIIKGDDHPLTNGTPYPDVVQEPEEPIQQIEVTENVIFDDFSSIESGWAQSDTEISAYNYSLDQYLIHVKQPSYISWSEVPVEFTPFEIEFDAITPQENSGGSFGVMCHIQDEANYYSVEIDLDNLVFSISMVVNDELIPLTNPEWIALNGVDNSEGSLNHFRVSCNLEKVRLFTNGTRVGRSDFTGLTPFSNPGKMAIFVATWENVSSKGYGIYFDNVKAWIP